MQKKQDTGQFMELTLGSVKNSWYCFQYPFFKYFITTTL